MPLLLVRQQARDKALQVTTWNASIPAFRLLGFLLLVNLAVVHEVLNNQAVLHVDAVKVVSLESAQLLEHGQVCDAHSRDEWRDVAVLCLVQVHVEVAFLIGQHVFDCTLHVGSVLENLLLFLVHSSFNFDY